MSLLAALWGIVISYSSRGAAHLGGSLRATVIQELRILHREVVRYNAHVPRTRVGIGVYVFVPAFYDRFRWETSVASRLSHDLKLSK